jgi:hypothetical protein
MELTALALFLTTTPQALQSLPAFTTLDGCIIPHAEGQAALDQGQAVLIGNLFVGPLGSQSYPLPLAA